MGYSQLLTYPSTHHLTGLNFSGFMYEAGQ